MGRRHPRQLGRAVAQVPRGDCWAARTADQVNDLEQKSLITAQRDTSCWFLVSGFGISCLFLGLLAQQELLPQWRICSRTPFNSVPPFCSWDVVLVWPLLVAFFLGVARWCLFWLFFLWDPYRAKISSTSFVSGVRGQTPPNSYVLFFTVQDRSSRAKGHPIYPFRINKVTHAMRMNSQGDKAQKKTPTLRTSKVLVLFQVWRPVFQQMKNSEC